MQCGDVIVDGDKVGVVTKELGNNSYSVVYQNRSTATVIGNRNVLYDYRKMIEQLEGGILKCVQEPT